MKTTIDVENRKAGEQIRAGLADPEARAFDEGRAAQVAGDQNTTGNNVEREQEHDEAQIFREHGVHEGGERGRRAVERCKRRQRQRAPDEGELAVMVVPEAREQQRPGRDREQNADERQRPRPAQRRAIENRAGKRVIG